MGSSLQQVTHAPERAPYRMVSVLLAVIVLMGSACSSGSSGSNSKTPQPTDTPRATPTLAPPRTPTASPSPATSRTDLAILKTADDAFVTGNEGTYTIAVTNLGPADTTGAFAAADELPSGVSLNTIIAPDWDCSGSARINCTSTERLVPGEASVIVFIVDVGDRALPSVTNKATLSYVTDLDSGNNSSTVTTPVNPALVNPDTGATDLSMIKNDISTFTVGDEGIYRLQVNNLGPRQTEGQIAVTDDLPSGLNFVSIDHPDYTCNVTGNAISCTSDDPMDPGAVASLIVTVFVEQSAYPTVTNSARVSYALDTNPANDVGNRPTTIRLPKE